MHLRYALHAVMLRHESRRPAVTPLDVGLGCRAPWALERREWARAADFLGARPKALVRSSSGGVMSDLLDRITINPDQCGGRPCIRGMRIRVSDVLELLAVGESQNEILRDYPYLEPDDIAACLRYAVRRLDHPTLAA